jgi:hypothetical protein
MGKLKYIPAGIRLHIQEIIYKVTNRLNHKYCISFKDIPDGLKAEKILKNKNIKFKSIPVPDNITQSCGVALMVEDYDKIINILKESNIDIEVFEYKNNHSIKLYGDLEYKENNCNIKNT